MAGLMDNAGSGGPGLLGGIAGVLQGISQGAMDPTGEQRLRQYMMLKELELKQRALEEKPQLKEIEDPETGYKRLIEVTVGSRGKPSIARDVITGEVLGAGQTKSAVSAPSVTQAPGEGFNPPAGVNKREARDLYTKDVMKKQAEMPDATANVTNTNASLGMMRDLAQQLIDHPGLKYVTGIPGMLGAGNVPGLGRDAAALENSLKSQMTINVLQNMRANSKTGGALGQVSNYEDMMMQRAIADLDRAQSYDQKVAALKKISSFAEGSSNRLNEAFKKTYGQYPQTVDLNLAKPQGEIASPATAAPMPIARPQGAPGPSAVVPPVPALTQGTPNLAPPPAPAQPGIARPGSKAEYDALPPGPYMAPDGSIRIKQ